METIIVNGTKTSTIETPENIEGNHETIQVNNTSAVVVVGETIVNGTTTETPENIEGNHETIQANNTSAVVVVAELEQEQEPEQEQILTTTTSQVVVVELNPNEDNDFVIVETEPINGIPEEGGAPASSSQVEVVEDNNQALPEYVQNTINQVAIDQGFTEYTLEITPGSNHGDGFVAVIHKIKINGIRKLPNGVSITDTLVLIAKIPPENEQRRIFSMPAFQREILTYTEILPAMEKFQRDRIKENDEGFFAYPKCYAAHCDVEKFEGIIVMEDIREQGFRMENKHKPVGFTHARKLMETLGQFHAVSFAMKHQCPDEFAKFKALKDIMNEEKSIEMMRPMIVASCERAITTLDAGEETARTKLSNFRDNIMNEIRKCTNGALAEPYAILNHGDCWINNMMYKYEGGNPRQICILDWQITRYASPVLDLVYFIFTCTNKALRSKYYDTLIQTYYKSLREHLERLGSDPNRLFPYTALLRQLKTFGRFALAMAVVVVPMICTENENIPDLDKLSEKFTGIEKIDDMNEVFTISENSDKLYRERMGAVIRDQLRLGYL